MTAQNFSLRKLRGNLQSPKEDIWSLTCVLSWAQTATVDDQKFMCHLRGAKTRVIALRLQHQDAFHSLQQCLGDISWLVYKIIIYRIWKVFPCWKHAEGYRCRSQEKASTSCSRGDNTEQSRRNIWAVLHTENLHHTVLCLTKTHRFICKVVSATSRQKAWIIMKNSKSETSDPSHLILLVVKHS